LVPVLGCYNARSFQLMNSWPKQPRPMKFWLLTKFSGNYGKAATMGSVITVIYKVMAFAKIPLMTENHLRYKANKR
jgi:hypothetical protein